jgi:uncharacterized protein
MDERLRRGTDQFNAGQFYEAHESWEELWLESSGNEKLFLQGLIQIAAGYVKTHMGGRSGALKLFERGAAKVRQAAPAEYADSVAPLLAAVAADVQRIQCAADPISMADVQPPRIVWPL